MRKPVESVIRGHVDTRACLASRGDLGRGHKKERLRRCLQWREESADRAEGPIWRDDLSVIIKGPNRHRRLPMTNGQRVRLVLIGCFNMSVANVSFHQFQPRGRPAEIHPRTNRFESPDARISLKRGANERSRDEF